VANIRQVFRQVETLKAGEPEFLLGMDNLEREWISLLSSLTAGLSMKLEQLQLIHRQLEKRQTTSLTQLFQESAKRLFTEILDVKDKIEKLDLKFSAFLRGDLEKSEIDDMAYLKEKERKFLESFNGWKTQLRLMF
jgi:hypothetical protein